MPLRNVATTFTIEQQRLEINNLAGDVNNIATGVTNVGTAATANALAAGATGADLTLSGTLTVNGSQTILNTATLEVEDKNIIIAKGSTTDAAASGGGITLKGADDKTISYNQTGDKWEFNKPLNVGGSSATAGSWGQTDWNLEVFDSAADCYTLLAGAAGAAIELRDTVTSEAFVIAANGDCNLYSYKSGDSMSFHTTNASGTGKRLEIDSDGNAWFNNNVNIPGHLEISASSCHIDLMETNSTNHRIRNGSGNFYIQALSDDKNSHTDQLIIDGGTGETALCHTGAKRFYTRSNGCTIDGTSTQSSLDLRTNNAYRGSLYADNNNDLGFLTASAAWRFKVANSGDVTAYGTVSDPKGDLRSVPQNTQGSAYDLVASDNGKHIFASGNVTIPPNIFSAGDIITVVNNTAGDINIVAGAGQGIYNSATASTAVPKTLAQRGMATILITNSSTCYVSGTSLTDP